jgi:hypothetical protein
MQGLCVVALGLSALLLQDGIEHLHDETLLSLGQCADAFELLLQLRCRPALACAALGRGDEIFDGDAELIGEGRQCAGQQPQSSGFVMRQRLLGDAHRFGQLHLGQSLSAPQGGDALPEFDIERTIFVRNSHVRGVVWSGGQHRCPFVEWLRGLLFWRILSERVILLPTPLTGFCPEAGV